MPVELSQIRDLLLPGLMELQSSFRITREIYAANVLGGFTPAAPHIWIPKLSIPAALAVGAAAAIIKNPEVTRRFWSGWAHASG